VPRKENVELKNMFARRAYMSAPDGSLSHFQHLAGIQLRDARIQHELSRVQQTARGKELQYRYGS
jgi:hypothetical protein